MKNTSGTSLRTAHQNISIKVCVCREKYPENKNYVLKERITGEKVKIIEMIFYFACLQAEKLHRKVYYNALTGHSLRYDRKLLVSAFLLSSNKAEPRR